MLEKSPYKDQVIEYELAISNQESISYYLSLLEHTAQFANSHLIKYQ